MDENFSLFAALGKSYAENLKQQENYAKLEEELFTVKKNILQERFISVTIILVLALVIIAIALKDENEFFFIMIFCMAIYFGFAKMCNIVWTFKAEKWIKYFISNKLRRFFQKKTKTRNTSDKST